MNIFSFKSLFDSHCHLNSVDFDSDLGEIITESKAAGVEGIIDVGVDYKSSKKSLEISKKYPEYVFSALGIHPEIFVPGSDMYHENFDTKYIDDEIIKIEELLSKNLEFVKMIGECGVDLYWMRKNNLEQNQFDKYRNLQIELFQKHLELAQRFNLPLSIHARDDDNICLNMLKPFPDKVKAVFHSFTGDYEQVKKILDNGFMIGINGIITYKSAGKLREAVKKVMGNQISSPSGLFDKGIVLETDSPLLSFGANRGKKNSPVAIKELYEFVQTLA